MADKRTRAKHQAPPSTAEAPGSRLADLGHWWSAAGTAGTAPGPAAAPAPAGEASPSVAQFRDITAANPDCLLWYRMGDFSELFFDDAVTASAALGIVLTKRGKHLGQDI